jgi:hypothetical protein
MIARLQILSELLEFFPKLLHVVLGRLVDGIKQVAAGNPRYGH